MATTEKLKGTLARRPEGGSTADRRPPQQLSTIKALFEANRTEIARALPRHMDADRMVRIAYTVVRYNPKLAECTPASLLGALMTASQLGLEPGPLGEAYFVPFWNSKLGSYEVTFIAGYQGLVKLAWQSDQLASLSVEAVYDNDEFEVSYGTDGTLRHRPPKGWPKPDVKRGDPIAYYAVAKLRNGGVMWYVMSNDDIEKIRARSRSKDDGPWMTDREAMSKKTVFKQLQKYMPKSPEIAAALAHDESVRVDFTSGLEETKPEYIEGEIVGEGGAQQSAGQPAGGQQGEPSAEGDGSWPTVAEPGSGTQA